MKVGQVEEWAGWGPKQFEHLAGALQLTVLWLAEHLTHCGGFLQFLDMCPNFWQWKQRIILVVRALSKVHFLLLIDSSISLMRVAASTALHSSLMVWVGLPVSLLISLLWFRGKMPWEFSYVISSDIWQDVSTPFTNTITDLTEFG